MFGRREKPEKLVTMLQLRELSLYAASVRGTDTDVLSSAIFVYAAGYSFGWNSLPLTLVAEIFSVRLRVVSMTICIML